MTELYQQIEERIRDGSFAVDRQFTETPNKSFSTYSLSLPVPHHHSRASVISETKLIVGALEIDAFPGSSYFLVDASLKDLPVVSALGDQVTLVAATEDTLKEIIWLDAFINNEVPVSADTIIGIGGGVLLNAAAYIAERKGADFVSVPTTILAAADSAIGGLVRINKIENGRFQKSFLKSVYEPSRPCS